MRVSVSLLLLFLLPATCRAWGGEGHQLVALIAEHQLTPQAKAVVKELLGDANISDAEVASWADEVRRQRRETAPWHYVDIPTEADSFDRARDGSVGNNVIDAIETQTKILADRAQPRDKRVEALKWLVHLIGDLHQPLHCAERANDNGGNKRLVFFLDRGKAVNLHQVWDTWLVSELVAKRRVAATGDALQKTITLKERKEWATGAPEQWANETHQIAVEFAYAGIAVDGPPPKLGRGYVQKAVPAVADRLKRAGVRLAMVLNGSAR
jgi:hypothetical protein